MENERVACERNQRVKGICRVAAPVTTENKRRAAISVSGPDRRTSEDRLRNELCEVGQPAANVIELDLAYE